MKKRLVSKVLKPHVKDCYSVKSVRNGAWGTPWAYLGEVEYRDSIGRLSRHGFRWWRVRCNCTYCPAVIVINETSILEAL